MASSSVGSLTGVFTNEITFDWFPEPILVANDIRGVDQALNNMVQPLEEARRLAAANIREHFETKSGPDGEKWPEWSESYEASGRGVELMVQSGATMEGASSPEAFDVDAYPGGGEVTFNGGSMPERGFWHHFGSEGRLNRWGAPNPLPRRSFIGIDTETQLAIVAEFDAWVGQCVANFGGGVSGEGGYQTSIFTHAGGWQQYRIGGWWGPKV